MERSKEDWIAYARKIKIAIDGCSSIGAVNALELHNDSILKETKKASLKLYSHLIDQFDLKRIALAKQAERGKSK